ncbi:hypothetical protein Tco_0606197 [Tanacetum coccineum]
MDDPNITMEEYIRIEEEKARRRGKVYNWETATYGKIWDNKDVHDLGFFETEFPAIVFNDTLTSEAALSCEPTVSSLNDNKIDFKISFDESDDKDCMGFNVYWSLEVYCAHVYVSPDMKSGFLDSGGGGEKKKKKKDHQLDAANGKDNKSNVNDENHRVMQGEQDVNHVNSDPTIFEAIESTALPNDTTGGVNMSMVETHFSTLIHSGIPNVFNARPISYINVVSNTGPISVTNFVNVVPTSPNKNDSDQVSLECVIKEAPSSYANKLSPTSLTKANLPKLDANVPNDAHFDI